MTQPVGKIPANTLDLVPEPEPLGLKDRLLPLCKGLLVVAVLAGALFAFRHYGLTEYVDKKALQGLIAPFGAWAPAVFILLCMVGSVLMILPLSLVAGLSTILFGTAWGVFWTVIGCALGGTAFLFLGRALGQSWLEKRMSRSRWRNLNLKDNGFYYLFLLRALSIVPFSMFNVACLFLQVRYRDFFLSTLLGLIPAAFLYAYGTNLILDPKTPRSTLIVFAVVALCAIVLPLIFRGFRQRKVRNSRL